MKILIVDDISDNIKVALNILKDESRSFSFAQSGEEALNLLKENEFDLILLDIIMPIMDGFEVCQRIKNQPALKEIPIIFFTAKDDIESITKAFEMGAADYISKPFHTQELQARVKNHLLIREYQLKLKEQVAREQQKNDEKDLIMLQQSKMAQMGEVFSMMTHQWRQPLNAISVASSSIEIRNRLDNLTKSKTSESIAVIENSVQHLSDTMETYKSFFKSNNSFEKVSLQEIIDKTLLLNQQMLKSSFSTLNLHIQDTNYMIKTSINEFIQILLVILQNSIDNFVEKNMQGVIDLTIEHTDKIINISIEDNGGGISEDNLPKIFDLNFSTKGDKGSGVGLYMVKKIVEDRLRGTISAQNTQAGVRFNITLPCE